MAWTRALRGVRAGEEGREAERPSHSFLLTPHLPSPPSEPSPLFSPLLLHPVLPLPPITMARTLAVVALLALAASASVSARSLRQAEAAPKMLDSE